MPNNITNETQPAQVENFFDSTTLPFQEAEPFVDFPRGQVGLSVTNES